MIHFQREDAVNDITDHLREYLELRESLGFVDPMYPIFRRIKRYVNYVEKYHSGVWIKWTNKGGFADNTQITFDLRALRDDEKR